jgi:hypothetical protein
VHGGQVAILFTFMDKFQPTQEIRNVVSRAQNAKFTNVTVTNRGSGQAPGALWHPRPLPVSALCRVGW